MNRINWELLRSIREKMKAFDSICIGEVKKLTDAQCDCINEAFAEINRQFNYHRRAIEGAKEQFKRSME